MVAHRLRRLSSRRRSSTDSLNGTNTTNNKARAAVESSPAPSCPSANSVCSSRTIKAANNRKVAKTITPAAPEVVVVADGSSSVTTTIPAVHRDESSTTREMISTTITQPPPPSPPPPPTPPMPSSSRPTLVRRMTSGTLGNDDSIRFDYEHIIRHSPLSDNNHHHHMQQSSTTSSNITSASTISAGSSAPIPPRSSGGMTADLEEDMEEQQPQQQQQQQQGDDYSSELSTTPNNKPPTLLVKKPSNCESEEDTFFEASSISSMEDNTFRVRKLPGGSSSGHGGGSCAHHHAVAARSKNDPEALKIQEIFAAMTEDDKETAARTSWKYYCEFAAAAEENPTIGTTNNNKETNKMMIDLRRRDALARAMIQRHLVGEGGDVEIAKEQIYNTLQARREERLDWVRMAWHPSPDWSKEQEEFCLMVRNKMSRWLGPTGRVCLMDYDEEDRCNFYHKLAIWTEGTRYDREAILYSASYMLEKAIACTERKSQGRQSRVNVVLDFRGANMRNKNQTLPISIALEVVELLKDHHPDRLWTITMIDAPFLARLAWPIFRPFVNHIVEGGVRFVTGRRQILRSFGPKMLHYDRATNLDMDKFFQLPFDQAYEDVHGHELEY